jgi:four helix bundle protein
MRQSAVGSRQSVDPTDNGPSEIRSYRDLRVWNEAMDLAEAACRMTSQLPKSEVYGFTAQIRRAAASVPANIAEGYGRESRGAYIQFLRVAQGSIKDLETHVLLAGRLGLLERDATGPIITKCETVGKMLRGLIRSLDRDP